MTLVLTCTLGGFAVLLAALWLARRDRALDELDAAIERIGEGYADRAVHSSSVCPACRTGEVRRGRRRI